MVGPRNTEMTGNGNVIFVPLWGNAKILVTEGPFEVLDENGSDGNGAAFQLHNPDPDGDGVTAYSVFVRALGKPGGKATLQSCYTFGGEEWCAVDFDGGMEPIELERTRGPAEVRERVAGSPLRRRVRGVDDITGACLDVDQVPLFGDSTLGYLWDYTNQGPKLAQPGSTRLVPERSRRSWVTPGAA